MTEQAVTAERVQRWGKVIDHESCIGCHACSIACKSENDVPLSVNRTYVKQVEVGAFPEVRRAFQVTRCNQCDDAPCVGACPTAAMYRRPDGIVDFDKSACIGCKACMAACPYDAIFINPRDHTAEKCNFCAHRLDVGLEPACVVVCPTEAIQVGDLEDPGSAVSRRVHREAVTVRRPEKGTQPKLFYRGAHEATLDPLAARRPVGGLFQWSEQLAGEGRLVAGHPGPGNSSAAALLSYDVPHAVPWDWRVSLYTLTKGIATGSYLVALLAVLAGWIGPESPIWAKTVPWLAGLLLALTGGLLIWDLDRPERFYLLFTRPQWRSWLVRGGFAIGAYGLLLVAHWLAPLTGAPRLPLAMAWAGAPLAALVAVYTAFLFAQARARDLWQSSLLPPHLLVQAVLAGAASLLPFAAATEPGLVDPLLRLLAVFSAVHLLLVGGEVALPHATAHGTLAVREMVAGRFKRFFWAGMLLAAAGLAAPWIGAWVAPVALIGLLAFEHAYVQAGQAVPLA